MSTQKKEELKDLEELAMDYWNAVHKAHINTAMKVTQELFERAGPVMGQVYLSNARNVLKMVNSPILSAPLVKEG